MRLRNIGQTVVVAPHLPLCRDLGGNEDNRNTVSQSENYSILTTESVTELSNANAGGGLNNNEVSPINTQRVRLCSESASISSREDSLGDYDGHSSSSIDIFPQGDEYQCFSQEDATDSDFSDDGNCGKEEEPLHHGITNPNYTGFKNQDEKYSTISDNNGNDSEDRVNHLDSVEHFQKDFYDKPKFEGCSELVQDLNIVVDVRDNSDQDLNVISGASDSGTDNVFPEINYVISSENHKFEFSPKEVYQDSVVTEFDGFESSFFVETAILPVSGVFETTVLPDDDSDCTPSPADEITNILFKSLEISSQTIPETTVDKMETIYDLRTNDAANSVIKNSASSKSAKETANEMKLVEQEVLKRKRENVELSEVNQLGLSTFETLDAPSIPPKKSLECTVETIQRSKEFKYASHHRGTRKFGAASDKSSDSGAFDVYNIETAMPHIDIDAIETHLKAAKEEERRRRNDREEIRRRLAMGTDSEEYYNGERIGRKPSLQARLQGGMNLQICFMNDTGSDSDSPSTDADGSDLIPLTVENKRPATLPVKSLQSVDSLGPRPSPSRLTLPLKKEVDLKRDKDLFACQARLQAEARQALMQAKEMARMQMEIERQKMPLSPITQMVRSSLLKVGVPFPDDRRRLSRQMLTEMNIAQLQVIINDLHSQIEVLNENLVEYLMSRDDLHMEQDSMLVDIEDITRYLDAKEKLLDTPTNGNIHHGSQGNVQNVV